eukprot:1234136-Rhodomonas_salina.1
MPSPGIPYTPTLDSEMSGTEIAYDAARTTPRSLRGPRRCAAGERAPIVLRHSAALYGGTSGVYGRNAAVYGEAGVDVCFFWRQCANAPGGKAAMSLLNTAIPAAVRGGNGRKNVV